jgi:16S rRNA (cytosine1407-C5)-methyltransferase
MTQDFHPDFIKRYQTLFSEEEFNIFLSYCNKPLKKSIRVNTSKISISKFEEIANINNWKLKKIPYLKN